MASTCQYHEYVWVTKIMASTWYHIQWDPSNTQLRPCSSVMVLWRLPIKLRRCWKHASLVPTSNGMMSYLCLYWKDLNRSIYMLANHVQYNRYSICVYMSYILYKEMFATGAISAWRSTGTFCQAWRDCSNQPISGWLSETVFRISFLVSGRYTRLPHWHV